MQNNINSIRIIEKHNGLFITANYNEEVNKRGLRLGLLLDKGNKSNYNQNSNNNSNYCKKRFVTKSVGLFSKRIRNNGSYNKDNYDER